MNQIDPTLSVRLAGELFDQLVVPLANARRGSAAKSYFPLRSEANTISYFSVPEVAIMQPCDFELPGRGTAEGLVDALAQLWAEQGEFELLPLTAPLKSIATELGAEADNHDGTVDIFCYTMF